MIRFLIGFWLALTLIGCSDEKNLEESKEQTTSQSSVSTNAELVPPELKSLTGFASSEVAATILFPPELKPLTGFASSEVPEKLLRHVSIIGPDNPYNTDYLALFIGAIEDRHKQDSDFSYIPLRGGGLCLHVTLLTTLGSENYRREFCLEMRLEHSAHLGKEFNKRTTRHYFSIAGDIYDPKRNGTGGAHIETGMFYLLAIDETQVCFLGDDQCRREGLTIAAASGEERQSWGGGHPARISYLKDAKAWVSDHGYCSQGICEGYYGVYMDAGAEGLIKQIFNVPYRYSRKILEKKGFPDCNPEEFQRKKQLCKVEGSLSVVKVDDGSFPTFKWEGIVNVEKRSYEISFNPETSEYEVPIGLKELFKNYRIL